jgi:hypothetical protein
VQIIRVKLDNERWQEHDSSSKSHGGKAVILWNQQAQNGRTVPNSKPNIMIRDNEERACMLVDVDTSGTGNVINK